MSQNYTTALERRLEWYKWSKRPEVIQQHLQEGMAIPVYQNILRHGDTFFMNERFCELVDLARRTIPDGLKFETEWMVSPAGFMWLEKPFVSPKMDSQQLEAATKGDKERYQKFEGDLHISAIGWFKVDDREIARINKTQNQNLKSGAYQFVTFLDRQFYASHPPSYSMWSYFILNPGDVVIDRIHRFEERSTNSTYSCPYEATRSADMLHEIRWIYTAMHLMSQKLATQVSHQAERPTRRRMKNDKTLQDLLLNPTVRVVTLRRMEEARQKDRNLTAEVIDWQWQWHVTGHWRNQYFPSVDENRIIWIEDYVKGPPDKPMKPPPVTIYKVER